MNWFTHRVIEGQPVAAVQTYLDQDSGCEHVEKDINLAYALRSEMDSFGPVGSWVCCKACDEAVEVREGNEKRICHDCKEAVKKKDGSEWRWYDFYAPQGDEPLFICNECRTKPAHLARVSRNRADYEAEFGHEDH